MPVGSDTLVVPTILPTGSLHFAELATNGKAQDVIEFLLAAEGLKQEILGDLEDCGWALQRARSERSGRPWEEDELMALGDGEHVVISVTLILTYSFKGVVHASAPIAPILAGHTSKESIQPHFSSFPMTGHLHNPVVRLISLNPLLSVVVSFQRVPEIHDGFQYKLFLSRKTTVAELVQSTVEELGLTKSLPIPGASNVEYAVEEVWVDQDNESKKCHWFMCLVFICYSRILETTADSLFV